MSLDKSVAIIGGGIAGLTALYESRKNGLNATLFERDGRVGGRIKTAYVDGTPVELGAGYFHRYYPGFISLVEEIGLSEHVQKKRGTTRIIKDGKVVYLSPLSFLLSGEFGVKDKLSVARLLLDIRRYGKSFQRAAERLDSEDVQSPLDVTDETLRRGYGTNFAEYVSGRVSPAIAKFLIEPACRTTVFEPAKNLNQTAGMGILMPATTELFGFREWMETITKALHRDLVADIHLGEEVQEIRSNGQGYFVRTNGREYDFDFVVATVPMPDLRDLYPAQATDMEYSRTRVTALTGRLKNRFDDGKTGRFLVSDSGHNIDNISRYSDRVFTVMSSTGMPEFGEFFEDFHVVHSQLWTTALPKLSPGAKFPSPVDESGTFYLAGDFYLPCMEMSVQTAKRAARKIRERIEATL